jgi:hypothetical protein
MKYDVGPIRVVEGGRRALEFGIGKCYLTDHGIHQSSEQVDVVEIKVAIAPKRAKARGKHRHWIS